MRYAVPLLITAAFLVLFGTAHDLFYAAKQPPQARPTGLAQQQQKTAQPAQTQPKTQRKTEWNQRDNTTMASIQAEQFVRQNLKAPRTAKFPGWFEMVRHTQKIGPQSYKVVSWVDAQNEFGATIRTKYYMEMTQTGPDSWRLDAFETRK